MSYVVRSLFVFALITSLGTTMMRAAAQGGDLATSYAEAQERGRRDESDPQTMDYHRDVLLPEFSARYRSLLGACQASLPQPDQAHHRRVDRRRRPQGRAGPGRTGRSRRVPNPDREHQGP